MRCPACCCIEESTRFLSSTTRRDSGEGLLNLSTNSLSSLQDPSDWTAYHKLDVPLSGQSLRVVHVWLLFVTFRVQLSKEQHDLLKKHSQQASGARFGIRDICHIGFVTALQIGKEQHHDQPTHKAPMLTFATPFPHVLFINSSYAVNT